MRKILPSRLSTRIAGAAAVLTLVAAGSRRAFDPAAARLIAGLLLSA